MLKIRTKSDDRQRLYASYFLNMLQLIYISSLLLARILLTHDYSITDIPKNIFPLKLVV